MKNISLLLILFLMLWKAQAQQMTLKSSSNSDATSLVVADEIIYSKSPSLCLTCATLGNYVPLSGGGTKLMWLPELSAFRAGTVEDNTNYWDTGLVGNWSFGTGYNTIARGNFSSAFGFQTKALASMGTVFGWGVEANDFATFACGSYNVIASGSTSLFNPTEQLFVIGNGTSGSNRQNALTVLKNGRTAIGFNAPQSMLHIKNGSAGAISYNSNSNLNVESNASNYISLLSPNTAESGLLFGNPTSSADGGLIYNNGNTKNLQFRTNGNVTRMSLSNAGNLTVTGSVTASCGLLICSDARYKKNITSLDNSLDNILKVKGLRYDLRQAEFPEKNFSEKNQIGFIAQDLEKIFPEMVFTDEKGYKSVDYGRLTPVLVEAVKEQQKQIDDLKSKLSEIEDLKAQMSSLKALLLKTDSVKMFGEK